MTVAGGLPFMKCLTFSQWGQSLVKCISPQIMYGYLGLQSDVSLEGEFDIFPNRALLFGFCFPLPFFRSPADDLLEPEDCMVLTSDTTLSEGESEFWRVKLDMDFCMFDCFPDFCFEMEPMNPSTELVFADEVTEVGSFEAQEALGIMSYSMSDCE